MNPPSSRVETLAWVRSPSPGANLRIHLYDSGIAHFSVAKHSTSHYPSMVDRRPDHAERSHDIPAPQPPLPGAFHPEFH